MKRLSILYLSPLAFSLIVALAFGSAACSRKNDTPKAQVDEALQRANLDKVHTSYDADAHVVHLQGTVDSTETRQRAEQVASGAVGTSGRVLDELKVEGMDDKTLNDRDKLIEDTLKDEISKDPALRHQDISFTVNTGAVTIEGSVKTAEEKARVGEMVKAVSGVNEVANELKIKPEK